MRYGRAKFDVGSASPVPVPSMLGRTSCEQLFFALEFMGSGFGVKINLLTLLVLGRE